MSERGSILSGLRRLVRRGRRPLKWLAIAVLALVLPGAPLACSTSIRPPAALTDPVTVLLLDYGRTPGLVLPADGAAVLYVYGDWNFYALRNTSTRDGLVALCRPTQGALGRRVYGHPLDDERTRAHVSAGTEHVYEIRVARDRAGALARRLDELFQANLHTRVDTPSLELEFVHHPRRYTAFANSNHRTASWLAELGCDVRGPAMFSTWRVLDPEE